MQRSRLGLPLLVLALTLGVSACSGLALPWQRDNGLVVSPPDARTGPGGAGGGGAHDGGGGAVGGGGGVIAPDPGATPGPDGVDPITGMKPSIETPVPGQVQPVAANVWAMRPRIDGNHVTVLLEWWSGPPPCSVLDSVLVVRTDATFSLTPMEGADPKTGGQVACPAIAMLRGTIVDLGVLAPGTWTLIAHGDLAPTEITIK